MPGAKLPARTDRQKVYRWPTDPIRAYRLGRVAHYARLNYSAQMIVRALQHELPKEQWVEITTVATDLKLLVQLWRQDTQRDAAEIVGEIDERLKHAGAQQLELYYLSATPRLEPHDPATKLTRDGRKPELIPAASHWERSQILANYQRAVLARSINLFGQKGGVSVTVNNQTTNQTLQVSGATAENFSLREVAGEVARQMRDGDLALPEFSPLEDDGPPQLSEPDAARRRRGQARPKVIDVEVSLQDELEQVARSKGRTGRTTDREDREEWEAD